MLHRYEFEYPDTQVNEKPTSYASIFGWHLKHALRFLLLIVRKFFHLSESTLQSYK